MAVRRAIVAALGLGLVSYSLVVSARPGAGHTFSGDSGSSSRSSGSSDSSSSSGLDWGSRSGSSNGSSGAGGGRGHPADPYFAGFLLSTFVLGTGAAWLVKRRRTFGGWDSGMLSSLFAAPRPRRRSGAPAEPAAQPRAPQSHAELRAELDALEAVDPDFSLVLFEDFLYALYAAAHEARGGSRLFDLRSYLGPQPTELLGELACPDVSGVVIGAMRCERLRRYRTGDKRWFEATVRFEANYTERREDGTEQTYYAEERWTLRRARTARSRPPAPKRVIGCPSCGAPQDKSQGNVCGYCGKAIVAGELDWAVTRIDLEVRDPRPPQLTSEVAERGTDEPTLVAPRASERLRAIGHADPSFRWSRFERRVRRIFAVLQRGWSSQRWQLVRPYVSDQLFQMQRYWIDTYRRSNLRNVTEQSQVSEVVLADARSDRYYDAITVRLFASGLDYTIDDSGTLVSGSRMKKRAYSEYWTLIRGRGAKQSGQPASDGCPNCGATLEVTMAGECEHCGAKVASGRFDWVLSRIEQDEAYRGGA